jgi:uncharacterized protein
MSKTNDTTTKAPRGFAALSPEKRKEIARRGGLAVQAKGTGYTWTSEQAKASGVKGGKAVQAMRRQKAKALAVGEHASVDREAVG